MTNANAIHAHDLSDAEREAFTEAFYDRIDSALPGGLTCDDREGSTPWGCPWYFGQPVELIGSTVDEMVDHFIEEVKDEIAKLLEEERRYEE